jgi:hypothetical protein
MATKYLTVAAAAAITFAGQLAGSPLAQAIPPIPLRPPCTDWVAYGPVTIDHSDGLMVKLGWNGPWVDPAPNAATLYLADGTPAQVDEPR